ncbi:hypothetical protein TWF696_005651 [Orbilia brochopaga]|uniref:Uncharacterized protein n=1 Tax=Orbilia brochopaga TaxID=3140254 RepID=A0AAV9V2N5_9PEZI
MGLLLNRLDRAIAIAVYFSASGAFALKTSQVDFLRKSVPPHRSPKKEHADSAGQLLNAIVDINNWLLEATFAPEFYSWYREAMQRRLDLGSTIAIVNSSNGCGEPGMSFMKGFLLRSLKSSFWFKRKGLAYAHQIPSMPEKPKFFPSWIITNIDVLQSPTDAVVLCYRSSKPQGRSKFHGVDIPAVPLWETHTSQCSSGPAETQETENITHHLDETKVSDLRMGSVGSTNQATQAIETEAARTIQKHWRIYSKILHDKLYIQHDPLHRRISQILQDQEVSVKIDTDASQKCFRMVTFVLLELTTKTKYQINQMAAKLGVLFKMEEASMQNMERIFMAYDIVSDLRERLNAIEKKTELPSLGKLATGSLIIKEIMKNIRGGRLLSATVSSRASEVDVIIRG